LASANGKFDAEERCPDEATRASVGGQMASFEHWIAAVARMRAPG
jgi:hypothetical protein